MSRTANRRTDSGSGGGEPVAAKVPALAKAIAVIRYVNRAAPKGASLHEIAAGLAITKSHCHNILKTLVRERWVIYDGPRRSYWLAPGLLADVGCVLARQPAPMLVHELLLALSRAVATPCVLTRIERDGSFVAIDKAEEASELLVSVPIGHRFPPDAPAQMRVRLAWMPEAERRKELAQWRPRAYTKTTIVHKQALWAELEATRLRGYSISRAEYTPGVMTLAAPIFDSFGAVQMVLQCPGLVERVADNEAQIAARLLQTTERLNAMFGTRGAAQAGPSPAPRIARRRRRPLDSARAAVVPRSNQEQRSP